MEISTTSLIYRSFKFHSQFYSIRSRPNDLCTFVRQYIWRMIVNSMFLFLIGVSLLSMIWCSINYFANLEDINAFIILGFLFFCILGLMVGFAIIVGLIFLIIFFSEEFFESRKDKKPGVVLSWIKAKKDKICPTIEYK